MKATATRKKPRRHRHGNWAKPISRQGASRGTRRDPTASWSWFGRRSYAICPALKPKPSSEIPKPRPPPSLPSSPNPPSTFPIPMASFNAAGAGAANPNPNKSLEVRARGHYLLNGGNLLYGSIRLRASFVLCR